LGLVVCDVHDGLDVGAAAEAIDVGVGDLGGGEAERKSVSLCGKSMCLTEYVQVVLLEDGGLLKVPNTSSRRQGGNFIALSEDWIWA
jgi:hypothetical protein